MFTNWLRSNVYASWILTLIRLYLGWEWMTAGYEKLTGAKPFDASGFLTNSIKHPVLVSHTTDIQYPIYTKFLESFALPHVGLINFIIPWGELLVGLGLILGTLTTAAMFFGLLMNYMYLFGGTVSSNPWDILFATFIIVAGYNAGRIGGDYWVIPWIRSKLLKKAQKKQ